MGRVAMEIVIGQSQTHLLVDIQKSFGHAAFQLIASFTASAGFTILFGASGAGKSTVLDCIAGIADPDAGRILAAETLFFDSSSRVNLPCQLRRVGYVFQDLALFPHMTVQANVSYGISAADAAQRSHVLLSSFRIAHLASRKPGEISGGERQRVALARALATDPRVLLLDEPLAGLDFPTRSGIIEDLRNWNLQHQKAILYVTHSRDEVFALGERVIVLEQGSVIADGTPHQVMAAPSQETVAQLAGFENIFDATVVARHDSFERDLRLFDGGHRHADRRRSGRGRGGRALLEQHEQRTGSRERDGGFAAAGITSRHNQLFALEQIRQG